MGHEDYSKEVSERAKLVSLESMPQLTDQQRVWIENAYRRGFYQGASAAVEGAEYGVSIELLKDWIYEDLFPWRYSKHDGKFDCPVWIGRNIGGK